VTENESPFSGREKAAPRRARAVRQPPREPKRGRAEKSADKRERILRAAIKVFARKGFYATRVSEIAKAAGVADGTIYLYFRNKDDVLVSVFESRITRLVEVLREVVSSEQSFEERFTRLVELQLGLLEGRRELAEVVTVNLRQSSKLLKQYAAPLFVQYLDVIAGLVAEGQQRGVVRADVNPRIVARSLWGALDGVALTWAVGGGEAGQLSRAAQQVSSVFLAGLLAHGAPAALAAQGAVSPAIAPFPTPDHA
jgi:TetR/AcrR family fatty acid metabolism transcriptional regulator